MTHTILHGDCIEMLRTLPGASVQCCVTSPPYWGLRDYQTGSWEGGDGACDHIDDSAVAERLRQKKSMIACGERMDGSTRTRVHEEELGRTVQFRSQCKKCGARRVDRQIGLEETPEAYVARMVEVFREVRRVLRDDGTLWLNLGDSYAQAGGRGEQGHTSQRKGRSNVESQEKRSSMKPPDGLKPKDLVGIPWRVAFALQADGWYLRQDIVWHKPNPMPESVRDRCTKSHEYVFLLTKSERYFYDSDGVSEVSTGQSGAAASFKRATKDHLIPRQSAVQHRLNREDRCDTGRRNRRSVWTITTKPYKGAHFATMPPRLAELCILAGTSQEGCCGECGAPMVRVTERRRTPTRPGADTKVTGDSLVDGNRDPQRHVTTVTTTGWKASCECDADAVPCTVLDPFGGSGTTLAVAAGLGRSGIACELNAEYIKLAEERIAKEKAKTALFN